MWKDQIEKKNKLSKKKIQKGHEFFPWPCKLVHDISKKK